MQSQRANQCPATDLMAKPNAKKPSRTAGDNPLLIINPHACTRHHVAVFARIAAARRNAKAIARSARWYGERLSGETGGSRLGRELAELPS